MLRMAAIVSPARALKGPQKQRGFASQTVELLLFTEGPEQVIFLLQLHVAVLFVVKHEHLFRC